MITEIDGPPRAYFEVYGDAHVFNPPDDPVVTLEKLPAQRVMLRFTYKAIYASSEEKLREFIQKVKDALNREAPDDNGIIFWRRRVTKFDTGSWSCRFATSPPLPESWWSQFPFNKDTAQYRLD